MSNLDKPFGEVMLATVGDTTWTALELHQLGDALLTWLASVVLLGHANPGSSLDYIESAPIGSRPHDLVADFAAWTSGRAAKRPGCEARIRKEIADSWLRFAMERLSETLDLGSFGGAA